MHSSRIKNLWETEQFFFKGEGGQGWTKGKIMASILSQYNLKKKTAIEENAHL